MAPDAGWSTVWPVIQSDSAFGRELMEWLAHTEDRRAHIVGAHLHEDQLADLYIWLEHQFPHHEDPGKGWESIEFHAVTPREDVAFWRDALLIALKNKGTPAAIRAIRRLQSELPELDWLRWSVLEAQAITRHATWTPLAPQELIALAQDPASRIVQNGGQLLDVIIESLERLQRMFRDETPAVFRLWNEAPSYRPKDEERLSDEVKTHLQADLEQRHIVVNREVVIRPTVPGFQGERLDLKIQAITYAHDGQPEDNLTVIIEVKGCWNRELPYAMQTQLCERYLKENTCQYGLYLVGWFNCPGWDNEDYRKSDAQSLVPALDKAGAQFEEQAQTLTGGGRMIRSFVLNAALPQTTAVQHAGNQTPQRSRRRRQEPPYGAPERGESG